MMQGAYDSLGATAQMHRAMPFGDCCARCGFASGDLRIIGCGCLLHTVSSLLRLVFADVLHDEAFANGYGLLVFTK